MSKEGLKYYLKNPKNIYAFFASRGLLNWMSDKAYLKMAYKNKMGKKLNLKNPQTFSEKLQWLKLYNRKDIYTTMVDKYEAKKFISENVGEEYVIPTLGVWDKYEDIDFDSLPNQFVLKCTHDSGGLIICKDKSKLDIEKAKKRIKKSLKNKFYWLGREWPYKNVKPRIIAEKYMAETQDDGQECLTDYKFFCFDGKVQIMYIANEKANPPTTDYFDANFNHLDLTTKDKNAPITPKKPEKFNEMVSIAEKLSKGIPFVRVDFYYINQQVYLGEFTFFHNGGMCKYNPPEWDMKLGEFLILPKKDK